ncbi:hypothetical protein RHECNPAF_2940023 [Rhizobium etli CNPAF512]|nr:hypothetical protein RHECNPAF_2940023 [Rhizobium etli CNPAF512]
MTMAGPTSSATLCRKPMRRLMKRSCAPRTPRRAKRLAMATRCSPTPHPMAAGHSRSSKPTKAAVGSDLTRRMEWPRGQAGKVI